MITVGGRKIIGADSVIVPDGEEAVLSYDFDGNDNITFSVVFESEEGEGKNNPHLEVTWSDEKCIFKFKNFSSATGHSLREPMVFADSDGGEQISLLATVYKYRSSHRITFQIMLGGDDE